MITNVWVDLLNKLNKHPLYLEYDLLMLSKKLIMFQVTHGSFDLDFKCLEWVLSADLNDVFTVEFSTFYYLICFVSEDDATHFSLSWEDREYIVRAFY